MLRRWLTSLLLVLMLAVLAGECAYLYWRERQPRENAFEYYIVTLSREAGMDPFLIRAVISRESKFDPLCHGADDERGLMQVMPNVGQMWAKANKIENYHDEDLYDPVTNIRVGTWYLKRSIGLWMKDDVDDPVVFALAEYNAGRTNARRWVDPLNPRDHVAFLDRITFPGTRKYVDVIMSRREQFAKDFADNRFYRDAVASHPTASATP